MKLSHLHNCGLGGEEKSRMKKVKWEMKKNQSSSARAGIGEKLVRYACL
jgi:hypothetical protein